MTTNITMALDTDVNVSQFGWAAVKTSEVNLIQDYLNQAAALIDALRQYQFDIEGIVQIYTDVLKKYDVMTTMVADIEIKFPDIVRMHQEMITSWNLIGTAVQDTQRIQADVESKAQTMTIEYNDFLSKYPTFTTSVTQVSEALREAQDLVEELRRGQVYRGTWNPVTNVYPDPQGTNSVWDIALPSGTIAHTFDGKDWHAGDRVVYIKDTTTYQQIATGASVVSVNGKSGALWLNATDIGLTAETGVGMVMRVDGAKIKEIETRLSNIIGGVQVSDTPPANPKPGVAWYDSTEGNTYIWYENQATGGTPVGCWIDQEPSVYTLENFGGVPMLSVMWYPHRNAVPVGYLAADGQMVNKGSYPSVWDRINIGAVPTITDNLWLNDPTKRGNFALSDTMPNHFRIPDYNGVYAGSIASPFLRGGGLSGVGTETYGNIQDSQNKNHTHTRGTMNITGSARAAPGYGIISPSGGTGAFYAGETLNGNLQGQSGQPDDDRANRRVIMLDASKAWTGETSADGGVEARPANIAGVWAIKMYDQILSPVVADATTVIQDLEGMKGELNNLRDSTVPVGSVDWYAGTTAPVGWLIANGDAVSRETYSQLFSVIGTTYGEGNGVETFNLPNLIDEFVRGYKPGAREVGEKQEDAIRNITGYSGNMTYGTLNTGVNRTDGAFKRTSTTGPSGGTTAGNTNILEFDASLVVPTAEENRPRNISLLPIIKAWGAANTADAMSLSKLENSLNKVLDNFSLAADPVLSVVWVPHRNSMWPGCVPADGQLLSRSVYPDAWAAIENGNVPEVPDADWLSDPSVRGSYTSGDGSTTFRIPDYNGIMTDSYGPVYFGGGDATGGTILRDRIQNITGSMDVAPYNDTSASSPIKNASGALTNTTGSGTSTDSLQFSTVRTSSKVVFDASRVARTGETTRPITAVGCWAVRLYGAVQDIASADVKAAATVVGTFETRVRALENRKSTCLVHATGTGAPHETVSAALPANIVNNSRYVLENPFGANVPVECHIQALRDGIWADLGFIYSGGGYGANAGYVQGIGIVIQTGGTALTGTKDADTGALHGKTGTLYSLPARIFIRRIDD